MVKTDSRPSEWYLLGIALLADVAGVIGFFGLPVADRAKAVIACILIGAGLLAATISFVSTVRLWLAPQGSFYPPGYHQKSLLKASIVLVVSILLGLMLLPLVLDGVRHMFAA